MRPPERSSLLYDLSHRMPHQPGHRGITISHKNPPGACRIDCTETIVRARGFFKVKVLDERHSFPETAFPYRAFAALSRDEWQMRPEIPDQLFHGLDAAKHASSGVIEAKVPLRQESVTAAYAAALQAYCVRKQPAGSNRRHSSFPTAASEGVQDGNPVLSDRFKKEMNVRKRPGQKCRIPRPVFTPCRFRFLWGSCDG